MGPNKLSWSVAENRGRPTNYVAFIMLFVMIGYPSLYFDCPITLQESSIRGVTYLRPTRKFPTQIETVKLSKTHDGLHYTVEKLSLKRAQQLMDSTPFLP